MKDLNWASWQINTAKTWQDLEGVLNATHVEFVDYDHKILLEYTLKLNLLFSMGQEHMTLALINDVKKVLTDLYAFACKHFEREEVFMKQYELPNTEKHLLEHEKILKMLKQEIEEYYKGHSKLSYQFKSNIFDWLLNHINGYDIDFFDIENWRDNIGLAHNWTQLKSIIYEVGIDEIDRQHKTLTELTLESLQPRQQTLTGEQMQDKIVEIKNYALKHFEFEIEFMKRYAIRNIERHIEEHNIFIEDMESYRKLLSSHPEKVMEVKKAVLMWWITHINKVDREYFSFGNWAVRIIENAKGLEDVTLLLRRTQIGIIDEDHNHVIKLAMDLSALIDEITTKKRLDGRLEEHVIELLKEIHDFAGAHFEREEKLLVEYQTDELLSHQEEHQRILKIFKDIELQYKEGLLVISDNLKNVILKKWLEHTNVIDYRTFSAIKLKQMTNI